MCVSYQNLTRNYHTVKLMIYPDLVFSLITPAVNLQIDVLVTTLSHLCNLNVTNV